MNECVCFEAVCTLPVLMISG